MSKKILVIIITLIIVAVLATVVLYYYQTQKSQIILGNPLSVLPATTQTSTPPLNQAGLKTYHNEQFNFEFQYPSDWKVVENPYRSPNLKFTLLAAPTDKTSWHGPDPFAVSIVSPNFVKQQYSDIQNLSDDIVIDGVHGVKYIYQEEGLEVINIILPIGQDRIILGTDKGYEKMFNQILDCFKFFK